MNRTIVELPPEEARARQQSGALLVDVREDGERAAGMADGALGVSRSQLEENPAAWLPDPRCNPRATQRSSLSAEALPAGSRQACR
jgi:rhodanese-related sulfurtransferase